MVTSLETRIDPVAAVGSAGAETWRADSVDSGRINVRLTGQWLRLKGPRPQRLSGVARPDDVMVGAESISGVYARTNTTNLVICARSVAQADRAARAIASLRTHYPTRAIAIVSDPALDRQRLEAQSGDGVLAISTRLVRPDLGSPTIGHFESVTVTAGPRQLGNPTSTAIPLCVPDLPIVLWWTGDLQYDLGLFRDLAASSDRVIVDSADLGDLARGSTTLASLTGPDGASPLVLVDLAWSRLRDWRNLVAQFYDLPPDPQALATIESVTIQYVVDAGNGSPAGQSSAFLLAGWLASRLGWQLSEAVTRTRDGLRLVFRSDRREPVVVRFQPAASRLTTSGIVSVTIASAGPLFGTCHVEQFSESELVTTSTVADHPPMTRHVMASGSDDSALLELVLQDATRDPVFEGALAVAARAFSLR